MDKRILFVVLSFILITNIQNPNQNPSASRTDFNTKPTSPETQNQTPPAFGSIVEGRNISPDGKEQITCDVPVSLRVKNCGGRDGAGLCVFTSIMFAALYQNVIELFNFQLWMRQFPGGGYPEKVDKMIAQLLKSQGKPENSVLYLQDTTGDVELLKKILATRRVACVTYNGHDIHYRGSIAHMVCLVHFTDNWAAVLDNNFIGENQIVWMKPKQFIQRWKAGGGWVVTLLEPPCPPIPVNK